MNISEFTEETKRNLKSYRALSKRLKKVNINTLDKNVHALDQEIFERTDCLACANCCKTTSPIFKMGDITRLSKVLKMKIPVFIDTYLHLDSDNDYVLNEAPCPFLAEDNTCIVYQSRPTACREYPHTNRKRFKQILSLSVNNTQVCPVVKEIFDKLEKVY